MARWLALAFVALAMGEASLRRPKAKVQYKGLRPKGGSVPSEGTLAVLGGALGHMVLGTLYCWGNFIAYAPTNLKYFSAADTSRQPDALSVIPITILFQVCAMPLGPLLFRRIGTRLTFIFSGTLIALGVYLASFATSLKTFMLFYACLFGFGVGLGYTSPLQAGWSWFPNRKGAVNGIVLLGFGCGGFFANLLGSRIANPKGLPPGPTGFPSEVYDRFPVMLRTLAAVYLVMVLLGGSQVRLNPASIVSTSPPEETVERSEMNPFAAFLLFPLRLLFGGRRPPPQKKSPEEGVKKMTVAEGLRTPTFGALYIIIALTASAGLTNASIYKLFAAASPKIAAAGDTYLATAGALGALCNGLGRLVCAAMVDHFGFKRPFFTLIMAQAANTLFFPFAARLGPNSFLVATCVAFFFLGGIFSTAPTCVSAVFDPTIAASVYSLVFSAFAIASIGGVQLAQALIPTLGWNTVFYVLAVATLSAAPLLTFIATK